MLSRLGLASIDGAAGRHRRHDDQDLAGVQVVDPLTFTITTDTPNALLPYGVMDLFIVQKASIGQIPRDQIGENPVWSQPGEASSAPARSRSPPTPPASRWKSRRNDDYWRATPFLDKIIRRAVPGHPDRAARVRGR